MSFYEKNLYIILGLFVLLLDICYVEAACTALSRNNYSANSILTSTALNADFNQLVTAHNSYDGECIQTGTVGLTQVNSDDFSVALNAIASGCELSYSDNATIQVDVCFNAVNGSYVNTTSAGTVTWGCGSCASEAASTVFYVYVADGSSGSTLNKKISTTAPNAKGYNGNDKVLGRFYNNATQDIDRLTVQTWSDYKFEASTTAGMLGYIKWPVNGSCSWTGTSTTYANFAADADCDDLERTVYGPNVTSSGAIGNSDGQSPEISFSSIPAGLISFRFTQPQLTASSGTRPDCYYRVYDGTNGSVPFRLLGTGGGASVPFRAGAVELFLVYTEAQGATTLSVQYDKSQGASCGIELVDGFEIVVRHYPITY